MATSISASLGHAWKKSILVEAIKPGNFLDFILKLSPTGEKQRIIFNYFLILSIKYPDILSVLSKTPNPLASFLNPPISASTSSLGNRS